MFRSSRVSSCGPEARLPCRNASLALTHTARAGADWEKGDRQHYAGGVPSGAAAPADVTPSTRGRPRHALPSRSPHPV